MCSKHEETLKKCKKELRAIDNEIEKLEGIENELSQGLLERWKTLRENVIKSIDGLEKLIEFKKLKQNGQGI